MPARLLSAFLLFPVLTAGQDVRAMAERAYIYAYPLVLMEFTRRAASTQGMNRFTHAPEFPGSEFRQIVRPNVDTLYSTAWLDLSKEPVLLHVPDTHGRFYLIQLLDAWTETFQSIGKRTTGTGAGWFAIVGPGWTGQLPQAAQRIDAPTNMVWVVGRTQTNGTGDYANVHAIQKGYELMPLSLYPEGSRPVKARPSPAGAPPPLTVRDLPAAEFFQIFNSLLAKNPPHPGDDAILKQIAGIGALSGPAVEEGTKSASKRLEAMASRSPTPGKNGWSSLGGKIGRYGTDYMSRAMVARVGLGVLPPEDAVYLSCYLAGGSRYILHFSKDELPPTKAFWSITMYNDAGYFAPNPLNRFALGDRDPLQFNPDGGLDIYLQHDPPSSANESNWLPAPVGNFNLNLRMYWPKEEVLNHSWTSPPVVRQP